MTKGETRYWARYMISMEPSRSDPGSVQLGKEIKDLRALYRDRYGVESGLGRRDSGIFLLSFLESRLRRGDSLDVIKCRMDEFVGSAEYLQQPLEVICDGFGKSGVGEELEMKMQKLEKIETLREEKQKSGVKDASLKQEMNRELKELYMKSRGIKHSIKQLKRRKARSPASHETIFVNARLKKNKSCEGISTLGRLRQELSQCLFPSDVRDLSESAECGRIVLAYKDLTESAFQQLWNGKEGYIEQPKGTQRGAEGNASNLLTGLKDKEFKREMCVDRLVLFEQVDSSREWKRIHETELFGAGEEVKETGEESDNVANTDVDFENLNADIQYEREPVISPSPGVFIVRPRKVH
eukprot:Nk52_evm2s413 gene=Nk52_evmTU2s413